jgi:hypothetical protein
MSNKKLLMMEAANAFLKNWTEEIGSPSGFGAIASVLAEFGEELTEWTPKTAEGVTKHAVVNAYPGIATYESCFYAGVEANIAEIVKDYAS